MKVEYKRTFAQFADNYITSYYSSGIQPIFRLLGGPILILIGVRVFGFLSSEPNPFLVILIWIAGIFLMLFGGGLALQPFLQLFVIWIRREEHIGKDGEIVTIEFHPESGALTISESEGKLELHINDLKSIQYRADSTWLLTQSDNMIFIPRSGLTSGDHDLLIETIESMILRRDGQAKNNLSTLPPKYGE